MANKITVVLVDDHNVVRKGLKSSIESGSEFEVIAEAASAEEATRKIRANPPIVLITDISLPGENGLSLAETVSSEFPEVNTLVLSMHKEDEYIIRAFEVGALGYLPKDSMEEELHHAIRIVESGVKYLTPFVSQVLANQFVSDSGRPPSTLTTREKQILKRVVDGLSNKQIAEELFISIRTVDTHRTNIMKKLEVGNTAELVRISISKKLV